MAMTDAEKRAQAKYRQSNRYKLARLINKREVLIARISGLNSAIAELEAEIEDNYSADCGA